MSMTSQYAPACANCGAQNLGTRFCESCGAPADVAFARAAEWTAAEPSVGLTPTSASVTNLRRLAFASFAGYLVIPRLFVAIVEATVGYGASSGAIIASTIILVVSVAALAGVAAMASPTTQGRRVGALLLAIASGVFAVLALATRPGEWPDYLLTFLAGSLLFLSWAVSAHFRGWGYYAVLAGFVLSVAGVFLDWFLGYADIPYWLLYTWVGIRNLVTVIACVALAIALERRHSQRAPRVSSRNMPGYVAAGSSPGYQQPGLAGHNASPVQPAYPYPPVPYAERTNALAVLSLVLGIIGVWVVPVVLGHIARAQIRRTGERGDGMAIAGLILGYVLLAAGTVFLMVVVWLGVS